MPIALQKGAPDGIRQCTPIKEIPMGARHQKNTETYGNPSTAPNHGKQTIGCGSWNLRASQDKES